MIQSKSLKVGFFLMVVASVGAIYSMSTYDWVNYKASLPVGDVVAQFGLEGYTTELTAFGILTTNTFEYAWCNSEEESDNCNKITAAQVFSKVAAAAGLTSIVLLVPVLLQFFSIRASVFTKKLAVVASILCTASIIITGALFLDLMQELDAQLDARLLGVGKDRLGHSFITFAAALATSLLGMVSIASAQVSK